MGDMVSHNRTSVYTKSGGTGFSTVIFQSRDLTDNSRWSRLTTSDNTSCNEANVRARQTPVSIVSINGGMKSNKKKFGWVE